MDLTSRLEWVLAKTSKITEGQCNYHVNSSTSRGRNQPESDKSFLKHSLIVDGYCVVGISWSVKEQVLKKYYFENICQVAVFFEVSLIMTSVRSSLPSSLLGTCTKMTHKSWTTGNSLPRSSHQKNSGLRSRFSEIKTPQGPWGDPLWSSHLCDGCERAAIVFASWKKFSTQLQKYVATPTSKVFDQDTLNGNVTHRC